MAIPSVTSGSQFLTVYEANQRERVYPTNRPSATQVTVTRGVSPKSSTTINQEFLLDQIKRYVTANGLLATRDSSLLAAIRSTFQSQFGKGARASEILNFLDPIFKQVGFDIGDDLLRQTQEKSSTSDINVTKFNQLAASIKLHLQALVSLLNNQGGVLKAEIPQLIAGLWLGLSDNPAKEFLSQSSTKTSQYILKLLDSKILTNQDLQKIRNLAAKTVSQTVTKIVDDLWKATHQSGGSENSTNFSERLSRAISDSVSTHVPKRSVAIEDTKVGYTRQAVEALGKKFRNADSPISVIFWPSLAAQVNQALPFEWQLIFKKAYFGE